mmetsp:Transcript_121850/g.272310  ORF Transcript_121850/g.272310 Transcript_121850/m.272310 type:complete len:234 (+) Transcript_121850:653-1354(+)
MVSTWQRSRARRSSAASACTRQRDSSALHKRRRHSANCGVPRSRRRRESVNSAARRSRSICSCSRPSREAWSSRRRPSMAPPLVQRSASSCSRRPRASESSPSTSWRRCRDAAARASLARSSLCASLALAAARASPASARAAPMRAPSQARVSCSNWERKLLFSWERRSAATSLLSATARRRSMLEARRAKRCPSRRTAARRSSRERSSRSPRPALRFAAASRVRAMEAARNA